MPIAEGLIQAAQARARKAADVQKNALTPEERARKVALLQRFESLQNLFQHPGWKELKEWFLEHYLEAEVILLGSEMIEDRDLQALRQEMIMENRIISLDSEISERVQLLRKQLSSGSEPA